MIDSVADVIRVVNLSLCLTVLALMAVRWRDLVALQRGALMLALALAALVLATAWGTVETLTSHVTAPGVRSYIILGALCWALMAVSMLWRDRR